jgi:hypothetical protein
LNVLSFEGTKPDDSTSAREFLSNYARSAHPAAEIILHADESASISYWELHDENGDPLAIR